MILSLLTMVVCGLFSPLTLAFSIPAYCFSRQVISCGCGFDDIQACVHVHSQQSKKNSKIGAKALARKQGVIAAYLNIIAVVFALVVAVVCTGLVIGLYGPEYTLQQCINKGMRCVFSVVLG